MGLFDTSTYPTPTVTETCSCGATFTATGLGATTAAYEWRTSHHHSDAYTNPFTKKEKDD